MSEPSIPPDARPPAARQDIVAEHELLRLAGIDLDYYQTLSEFDRRMVLKMAERLVNADRRAADQTG
jgi:hypothetical protein